MIGASVGLAARARDVAGQVVGVSRRDETLRVAQERGAIQEATTDLATAVADADLVVICTPVETIATLSAQAIDAAPTALVTDAGSTKLQIVETLARTLPEGARFVGSHPVAGSEQTGPAHGNADLFQGRPAVVTPTEATPESDVDETTDFWESLGARVFRRTAADHDAAMAAVSHLPHVLAAALVQATPNEFLPLSSTGLADTTRIAAGDPELWRQILATNRAGVLQALDRVEQQLDAFRAHLDHVSSSSLEDWLRTAQQLRATLDDRDA